MTGVSNPRTLFYKIRKYYGYSRKSWKLENIKTHRVQRNQKFYHVAFILPRFPTIGRLLKIAAASIEILEV